MSRQCTDLLVESDRALRKVEDGRVGKISGSEGNVERQRWMSTWLGDGVIGKRMDGTLTSQSCEESKDSEETIHCNDWN